MSLLLLSVVCDLCYAEFFMASLLLWLLLFDARLAPFAVHLDVKGLRRAHLSEELGLADHRQ